MAFRTSIPTYSAKYKPTEKDANVLGYVFARRADSGYYSGVKWDKVKLPEYDRWCRTDDKPRAR